MILFVDSETSGLPNKDLPLNDPSQPWVVSLAAQLDDNGGNPVDWFTTRIRGDGRKIRSGAEAIHGMSNQAVSGAGVTEIVAIGMLVQFANQATHAVGHGVDFDKKIITGIMLRAGKDIRNWTRAGLEFIDTMKAATPFCRLAPNPPRDDNSYKWPSLDEACQIMLDEEPRTGVHCAWDDMQRARRLFYRLRDLHAVEIAA